MHIPYLTIFSTIFVNFNLFFVFDNCHQFYVQWHVIVVLIDIFLMISDIEHLFIYLLAICVSLEKCLFRSFPIFKLGYFLLLSLSSLYILDINPLLNIWFTNIFLYSILPFHSADIVFWCKSIFNFNEV